MGVKKFWSLVEASGKTASLLNFHGKIFCIDFSCWICADKSVNLRMSQDIKLYLRNIFFRICHLLQMSILPYPVFDGAAPDIKYETMKSREGMLSRPNEKVKPFTSLKRSNFSFVSREISKMLDLMGIPWIVAPGEAEKLCAHLNIDGIADFCVSNDGDSFLYGAKSVLRNFGISQKDHQIYQFNSEEISNLLNFNRLHFILLGLICGCDYYPNGVPKIGPRNAILLLDSIRQDSSAAKVIQILCGKLPSIDENEFVKKQKIWSKVFDHFRDSHDLVNKIVSEFTEKGEQLEKFRLPKRDNLFWSRPNPAGLVKFFQEKLDWPASYTLIHVLPILACWDLRRSIQIIDSDQYRSLSSIPLPSSKGLSSVNDEITDDQRLKPCEIVKECRVNFIDYYTVRFEKLGCDIWTTCQWENEKEDYYRINLKKAEVSLVHLKLINEFLSNKKKPKAIAPKRDRKKLDKAKSDPVDDLTETLGKLMLIEPVNNSSSPKSSGLKKEDKENFSHLFLHRAMVDDKSILETSIVSSCDEFSTPKVKPLRERLMNRGVEL